MIAVVALVVIGPKDLPRVMRTIGEFAGRARGMARHFRSGIDNMIRETELADMEKLWKADNERIMREHPSPLEKGEAADGEESWAEPAAEPPPKSASAPASKSSRPKAPLARGRTLPSGAAPPIPARPVPPASDESA